MHLVTGGAFNGKKQWVKEAYSLGEKRHIWHSFYHAGQLEKWTEPIVVLEGIERHVRRLVEKEEDAESARQVWNEQLTGWIDWESKEKNRQLILIGTDMTKGVVPANAFDRRWRDATGWCFQAAAKQACQVIQIWYGLPQIIKNKGEEQ